MANNHLNQQDKIEEINSNIIFGTSSDSIEQGLHNGEFTEEASTASSTGIDDKDVIVNEQEQNEVVNASEEKFNEGTLPESSADKNTLIREDQKKIIPSLEDEDEQDNDEEPIVSEEK